MCTMVGSYCETCYTDTVGWSRQHVTILYCNGTTRRQQDGCGTC